MNTLENANQSEIEEDIQYEYIDKVKNIRRDFKRSRT